MPDVYELAQAQREKVLANDKATRDALIQAYAASDRDLQKRCAALLNLIERRRAAGEEVSWSWLQREARYNALIEQVSERVKTLAGLTAAETADVVRANLQSGTYDALALIEAASGRATVAGAFDRLNTKATENMAAYLDAHAPLGRLLARIVDEMPTDAVKAAKEVLLVGVSTGQGPRVVAHNFRAVTGASLTRSLTIARTESLRAYRQASLQIYAESDVVTKWQWLCTKSARTCVACLAQDGKVYDKSAQFPAHVRCRCTSVPVVGQPRERQTGEEWLKAQDEEIQDAIMGPAAASAWRKGEVELRDFVSVRQNPEYGASVFHDSLKGARERAKARKSGPQNDTNPDTQRGFGTAKAARGNLAPVGTPMSTLAQIPDAKQFQIFRNAAASVGTVHGFGNTPMPRVSFHLRSLPRGDGEYNRAVNPPTITVSPKSQDPILSALHEIGYYVADNALGQQGKMARYDTDLLRGWQTAVQSSRAFASLQSERDAAKERGDDELAAHLDDYLLLPSELWARSYAQYVATRAGDRAALNSVADRRLPRPADGAPYLAQHWDDDDFEPVGAAFDALLQTLGWLSR